MLIDTTMAASRAWNTWSDKPADLVFLPLGLQIAPVLYSSKLRQATRIEPLHARLGRHATDGSLIELEADHAGTTIRLAYHRDDPWAVLGAWNSGPFGEWGLRFSVALCLSAEGGETVDFDEVEQALTVSIGGRHVALVSEARPVIVTVHESPDACAADFEENGYFTKVGRGHAGPTLALRFNLEMMRDNRFAAAVADRRDLAIAKARALLANSPRQPALPRQTGRHAGALDAVRDVMGWNTVWDPVNRRSYVTVSRIWNLGKFAVWYNDQTYAALMTSLFDGGMAAENMAAALSNATPQGNMACIVTSNDAWVDRTQVPNGALVAWTIYLRRRERTLIEQAFEPLASNHRWWRAHRDPDRSGLVSCGTSDVGDSLYKGTHFGARNETGMDNSATHDEATFDPETGTLSLIDLGLNCSLALDAEMLSLMAAELGRLEEAETFKALAEASRRAIRATLWDDERAIFANRQRRHEGTSGFVRSLGPTSFYPLICGAASPDQARHLLRHLADPSTFAGRFGLPNATRDDPAFAENTYWRGRIWPNVNWFMWQGLRRYGFLAEASALADNGMALFMQSWAERRICGENYNADTGLVDDHPDNDPFYAWGAMLPMLGVAEVMDVNPWGDWEIVNTGEPVEVGPLASPIGQVTLQVEAGRFLLHKGEALILSSSLIGRITDLSINPGLFTCRLWPTGSAAFSLTLPQVLPSAVIAVRLDGDEAAWRPHHGGIAIDCENPRPGAVLSVHSLSC